jgi:hypothetical protein
MTGKERAEIALTALKLLVDKGESGFGPDRLWIDVPLDDDQVAGIEAGMNAFLMDQIGYFTIVTSSPRIVAYTGLEAVKHARRDRKTVSKLVQMLDVEPVGIIAKVRALLDERETPDNLETWIRAGQPRQQFCCQCGKFVKLEAPDTKPKAVYCKDCSEKN